MSAAKKFLTEDLPYGKESLKLPDMKEGRLCVPGSMSAELQFKISDSPNRPAVYRQVSIIEENGVILFSSGSLTDKQGHIGKRVLELFEELKIFKESSYAFGD